MLIAAESLIPILFKVLFALIAINCIVNLILYLARPRRMYMLLFSYWISLLGVFFIQASFQHGNLPVALAFAATFLPVTILALVAFSSVGEKFPLKPYLVLYAVAPLATFGIHSLGGEFTAVAMPLSLASAAPLFHSAYLMLVKKSSSSTRLQKFLGAIYCLIAIHAINFALFRMAPDAQLWGWLVAYACYDVLGILMPSIALEEANLDENRALEDLVYSRTEDLVILNDQLKKITRKNENLLKVLLHDVSNPLQTLMLIKNVLAREVNESSLFHKFNRSLMAIEKVIQNARLMYGVKNLVKKPISRQEILECVEETRFLYEDKLNSKNLELTVNDNLSPDSLIVADKTAFTHSLLGNLISNAIKFSPSGSNICLNLNDSAGWIEIEVIDHGAGMPLEQAQKLLRNQDEVTSRIGTQGEAGYGMGISIIQSFMEEFGGELEINSRPKEAYPKERGTTVKIKFANASES